MNCDYYDAGLALMKAKKQPGDVDSELAHAIRDYCGGLESVPEYLTEAIGAVQAELKLRVRRTWHESEMAKQKAETDKANEFGAGHASRNAELKAELRDARERLDSLAYDIGELPARFVAGDVPAAASLIRQLPHVHESIRTADSVLNDNE